MTQFYEIRVEGHLDGQWTDWFDGLSIRLEPDGTTLLSGPVPDQPALYGLLRKVRDFGLPLVSVNQVQFNEPDQHHLSKGENTMTTKENMNTNKSSGPIEAGLVTASPKRLARIAGIFYLLVGIFGGFAVGFADPGLYVAGNAAATAANIIANPGFVRMTVVAHLLNEIFFIITAMVLYTLLQHVNKSVARAMLVFVILAVGIMTLNTVFQFESMQVATNVSYATAFGTAGSNALVLLLLDIQHYGTLIAQIFFGLWLTPLGYLAYKSGLFPQGTGSHPRRGHHLLLGRPARDLPGPRLR